MKRSVMILIVLTFIGSLSIAQMSNTPLGVEPNTLSVSFSGGAFIPAVGKYDATLDINDVLETGPTFGVSLKYSMSPMWSLRGTYDFAYNIVESKYRPAGEKPAFVAPMSLIALPVLESTCGNSPKMERAGQGKGIRCPQQKVKNGKHLVSKFIPVSVQKSM